MTNERLEELDTDELERRKLIAEIDQLEAQRESAQVEADMERLKLTQTQHEVEKLKAHPSEHNIYPFHGSVNGSRVRKAIKRLGMWSRREPKSDITVIFNSPGGEVIPGLALYDFMRELSDKGHTIETVTIGYAASMAGVLLQAGDHRVIGPNAFMLIHEVKAGAIGSYGELKDRMEFLDMAQGRLLKILAHKSKLDAEEIRDRWERKDWWLDAEEVVELGFADEIRSPDA